MYPEKCTNHERPVTALVSKRRPDGRHGTDYRVQCPECDAAGEWRPSRDGAIAAWNRAPVVDRAARTVKPAYAPGKIPPEDVERAVRGGR